jgi:microcystin-dependent protein
MPGTPTPKHAIPTLAGSDLVRDIDTNVNSALTAIDSKMVAISEGPIGSRPTSTPGSPGVLGRQYRATDQGGKLYFDFGTGWTEMGFAGSAHEPGDLKATARSSAPAGWLMCDGSLVSTTTYADLFAAIAHAYNGNVDPGGGQFRLPDLRGRVPVGVDGAAGRLTANDALGQSGGAEKHTLTEAELAVHDHPDNITYGSAIVTDPSHVVALAGGVLWMIVARASSGSLESVPYSTVDNWQGTQGSHSHPKSGGVQNAGGGQAHNIMQPFQVFNWLVKT